MSGTGRLAGSPKKLDDIREATKDYELAIKSMKEQITLLKNKLAAAEDAVRRYRCNEETELVKELKEAQACLNIARQDLIVKDKSLEQCEVELKELGAALRLYEEENSRLAEERDHWAQAAKEWEVHYTNRSDSDEKLAEVRYYQSRLRDVQTELNQVKGSRGDYDSLRLEEQLKAANRRYQMLAKKSESLEKEKQELEKKLQQLTQEKKKFAERWQNLASRVKSDEKLRARVRDLEDAGNILSTQLEAAIQLNRDLEEKLVKSEQQRSREYATVRKALEESRKSAMKVRMMAEENGMLSLMNKELSARLSRYEAGSQRTTASPRLEAAYGEERAKNQSLVEEVTRLRGEVAGLQSQLSHSVSPDITPRKGRKHDESLGSLVKSLKEMAESPLRAMKDSDAESDRTNSDKSPVTQLDSLSNRVHVLEAERRSLQRKLKSAQMLLSGAGDRSTTPSTDRREEQYWTPTRDKRHSSKSNSPSRSFQGYEPRWL